MRRRGRSAQSAIRSSVRRHTPATPRPPPRPLARLRPSSHRLFTPCPPPLGRSLGRNENAADTRHTAQGTRVVAVNAQRSMLKAGSAGGSDGRRLREENGA
eukprot:1803062-Prymnesium_polylepis.1